MDPVTLLLVAAAAFGSFWGGRRTSSKEFMSELMQRVEYLEKEGESKDKLISSLQGKVGVLESLVTQRAEVEVVHQEVLAVRDIAQRIASKLDV